MSRGVNKACLLGNVGNDPDVRATSSGARLARISLATNRSFKDRAGETRDDVQWHNLVVWGKLVDVVEKWVKKGDRLYVEGRIEYSQSEKDGQVRYYTNIVVSELLMLGSSSGQARSGERYRDEEEDERVPVSSGSHRTPPDDDLPF